MSKIICSLVGKLLSCYQDNNQHVHVVGSKIKVFLRRSFIDDPFTVIKSADF